MMYMVKRNLKKKSQPTFFFTVIALELMLGAGFSLSYISGNIFIFFYEKVMNVIR